MPTLLEQVDESIGTLIQAGATPELISRRSTSLATEPTKEYFRLELRDPETNEYVLQLSVSNWAQLQVFLEKPATEDHNLQKIYQQITADIGEALLTQNSEKLILSLLLGVKAVKP